ncbi:MAG: pyridoxal 5'-phosphate synthase glutaminase subunit PdxT [Bacillota bacterium]
MTVGVVALQGAFIEHRRMLDRCQVESAEVRRPDQLAGLDGLIIPGGESTTIGKLMVEFKLLEPIKELAAAGVPVFGTCAGLVLLAKDIVDSQQPRVGMMDIVVQRNAYGRQVDSFEADLQIDALGKAPFRGVFIRAPYITRVKPNVGILAIHDGKIIFARQGNLLACAFHPELTGDARIHRYFSEMIKENINVQS